MRHRLLPLFMFVIFCCVLVTQIYAQDSIRTSPTITPPPNQQSASTPTTSPSPTNTVANPHTSTGTSFSNPQSTTAKSLSVDDAEIEDISTDQSVIQVSYQNQTLPIAIKSQELKVILKGFSKGDRVTLQYDQEPGQRILQSMSVKAYHLEEGKRLLTLLITAILLLLTSSLLLEGKLLKLIIGEDNRYSNSKTQIATWFFILIVTYISTIFCRILVGGIDFVGGIQIPQNLLILSGLSAFTYAAAKGITVSKIQGTQIKNEASEAKLPHDLYHDDKDRVDLGDFQMIIITLLAVVVYLLEIFGFLSTIELHRIVTLPDVDTTILATFGLGQGAYLVKKLVSDVSG